MDFMGDLDRDQGDFDMGMGMMQGGRRGQMDQGRGLVDMGDGRRDDGISDMMHGDFLGGLADQGLGRAQRDRGRDKQMDAQMGMDRDRIGMGMGLGMGFERDRMDMGMNMAMNRQRDQIAIDTMAMDQGMINQDRMMMQNNMMMNNQMNYDMENNTQIIIDNQGYEVQSQVIVDQNNYYKSTQQIVVQKQNNFGYSNTEYVKQKQVYNPYDDQVQKQEVVLQQRDYYQQSPIQTEEVVEQVNFNNYGNYQQQEIIVQENPFIKSTEQVSIQKNIFGQPVYQQQQVFVQKKQMGMQQFNQGMNPITNMDIKTKEVQLMHPAKFQSPISVHKIFEWKLQFAKLNVQALQLPGKVIPVKQITKLKCLDDEGFEKHRQLKVVHNMMQDVFFAAQVQREELGLPLQYAWFAKIINAKMFNMGYDLQKSYVPDKQEFSIYLDGVFCKGLIFKKSQFLGKWQRRFIVINSEGLFSYKNPNEPFSFSIKAIHVKYLWTRFDVHNNHLVIKIKHGVQKTQFAIPIVNFCVKSEFNWLWGFYRLLMERNIMHQLK